MKRFLLPVMLLTIAACVRSPAPPPTLPVTHSPTLLQIGVSSSASQIVPLTEQVYAQENPQIELQFVVGNNATLLNDLANGLLDAVLVHHIPDGNQRYYNPVAVDGLVLITHPDNPVQGLTSAEAQAIFNGRITNWQSVGGEDQVIVLLSREQGSELRTLLRQRMMAEQRISANAQILSGDEAMLAAVASNVAAVGLSSMSSASQNPQVKRLDLDGRSATPVTTANQTYPLTSPLYFVASTEIEPAGELRAFLAWLQSDAGQLLLGEVYGRIR